MSSASPPARSTNLPTPLTSLVGRERELATLCDLLRRDYVRLLTLTGPGGVGKTRLALRLAENAAGDFPDGTWFVPLASIRDPALVPSAIAQALDVRETGHRSLLERIAHFLQGKDGLLILDNFEHVVASAPIVTELLSRCPSLTCVVTSRALLRVSGEHAFPVPPLPLPPAAHATTAERASMSPAVRLFVSRAQAARPDFSLTDANAAEVEAICRRLDGLPLAIELAAARARHFTPTELAGRLVAREGGSALHVLAGGLRDAPDRQQTLRYAIAWSYDLLDPQEQVLFRRLAVFVGGFTLEVAEAVANAASDAPIDVVEGIAALVDQSLLQQEEEGAGTSRYGMLETIRAFGLERLAAGGEGEEIRRRHAEWCLAVAERAGPHVKGPEAAIWLAALERDHANLRVALSWLLERGDGPRLVRLAGAFWPFWQEHAHYREGRQWLEVALGLGPDAPAADRLRALNGAGTLAWYQTDIVQARQWHEQALALAREVGDRQIEAFSLSNLGAQAAELGEHDQAVASFEAGLALARAIGDCDTMISALHNLAYASWMRGEYAVAADRFGEALTLAREHGRVWLMPTALNGIGFATVDLGDYRRATASFHEALASGSARGNLGDIIDTLEGLAKVGAATGQVGPAVRLFGAADALRAEIARPQAPTEIAYFAPVLNALRDALGATAFAAAWAGGRALSPQEAMEEALAVQAEPAEMTTETVEKRLAAAHGLSARELEVLRLVATGRSNREIGELLFISRTTAARHVANIFNKLNVASRAQAMAYAHQHGLD
jgi:predicted ATPase/DNA-binding CsgD family transcriptional regulator